MGGGRGGEKAGGRQGTTVGEGTQGRSTLA